MGDLFIGMMVVIGLTAWFFMGGGGPGVATIATVFVTPETQEVA